MRSVALFLILGIFVTFAQTQRLIVDKAGDISEKLVLRFLETVDFYRIPIEVTNKNVAEIYEAIFTQGEEVIKNYMLSAKLETLTIVYREEEIYTIITYTNPAEDFASHTCFVPLLADEEDTVKGIISCVLKGLYELGRFNPEKRKL